MDVRKHWSEGFLLLLFACCHDIREKVMHTAFNSKMLIYMLKYTMCMQDICMYVQVVLHMSARFLHMSPNAYLGGPGYCTTIILCWYNMDHNILA